MARRTFSRGRRRSPVLPWFVLLLVACGTGPGGDSGGASTGGSSDVTASTEAGSSGGSVGTTLASDPTGTTGDASSAGDEPVGTTGMDLGFHDPECPPLVLDDDLGIHSVADTVGLPAYTHVTGEVAVVSDDLVDLTFFSCLERIDGNLIIYSNASLVSVEGLERLSRVGGNVQVWSNVVLTSLEGLGVQWVEGSVAVFGNPELTVAGLRRLERAVQVAFGSCGGPPGGPSVGIGNDAMAEIDGLDSLVEFDRLAFMGNESLVSLDGLIGLAERTGAPTAGGPELTVDFRINDALSIDVIEAFWSEYMQDGPALTTCGNLDEAELCQCTL